MNNQFTERLTASEITSLWQQFIFESFDICIKKYVLAHVEDADVRSVYEFAMSISERNLENAKYFLSREQYPLPIGFTDQDVHPDAPRLFSDAFWLKYIQIMSANAITTFSLVITTSSRPDIRHYFSQCSRDAEGLFGKSSDVLLSKGMLSKPPHIPAPDHQETMKPVGLMSKLFGESRPLNGFEITHIYYNLQKTEIIAAMAVGFYQVMQSEKVRDFGQRFLKYAKKHSELFQEVLQKDRIPLPSTWESEVTNSSVPPFSDKLMLTHLVTAISSAIQYYGTALSTSMRPDVVRHYLAVIAKDMTAGEDAQQILIENGWVELPPHLPAKS